MPVKVSHTIDLGPGLSNEVMDVARKQGEDPERVIADIQELRDMIFGRQKILFHIFLLLFFPFRYLWIWCNCVSFIFPQNGEFVCHRVPMMIFSFDSYVLDFLSWNMHTTWSVFRLFICKMIDIDYGHFK